MLQFQSRRYVIALNADWLTQNTHTCTYFLLVQNNHHKVTGGWPEMMQPLRVPYALEWPDRTCSAQYPIWTPSTLVTSSPTKPSHVLMT